MSDARKYLPDAAEDSSVRTDPGRELPGGAVGAAVLSLCEIVVWVKMGELSLAAGRWHGHCISGRPEGSA